MEYHQDRFDDFSLLVFKKDKVVALLPANKVGNNIYSHQGLSYGGLLLNKSVKIDKVITYLQSVLDYLREQSIEKLHLKLLPKIYHDVPSDELDYLLFILKAELLKCETLSVIDQRTHMTLSRDRVNGIKRGHKNQLIIREENEFDGFWNDILKVNLETKHGVMPVHSLKEIKELKVKFPKQIRQFNVYLKNKLVAGTTIFESKNVAHCQYISANEDKNLLGSLDILHDHLITKVFKDKRYYDFGSSNENDGTQINEGLHYWKEGFGARTIIQQFFTIQTKNSKLLNGVLK